MKNLKKFFKDESGATAIEYGLLAALISVAGVVTFQLVGDTLIQVFARVAADLALALS